MSAAGTEVWERRVALGLSIRDLAGRAQVDRGKLARFENGDDEPSARWIALVTRALEAAEQADRSADAPGVVRGDAVVNGVAITVEGSPDDVARVLRRIVSHSDDGDQR